MSLLLEVAAPPDRYADTIDRLVAQRDRLTATQARSMQRLLADVRRRLLDDLTRLNGGGSAYQTWQLGQLRQAVEAAVTGLVRRVDTELQDDLRHAWEAGGAFQPTALAAAGVMLTPRAISIDQLLVAQELAGSLVTRLGSDALTQLNRIVTLGVTGSVPIGRLMSQVADVLRTQPTRANPRLGSIAYQAERIVRHEMLNVFATADAVRVADVAEQVPGLLKIWDAVGDERTRPDHASAGRRYGVGGEPGPIPVGQDFTVGGHRAARPHDPRLPASQTLMCRCVRRLWSPEWAEPAETPEDTLARQVEDLDADYADRIEKLDAQASKLADEYGDLTKKIAAADGRGDYALADRLQAQLGPIGQRAVAMADRTGALRGAREDALRKLFAADAPSKMRVQYGAGVSRNAEWNKGIDWVKKTVGDGLDYQHFTRVKLSTPGGTGVGREASYYQSGGLGNGVVNMRPGAGASTMVHELGHFLEDMRPLVRSRSVDFVARRTAGEALQRLRDLRPGAGYDPSETTRPDRFISPYIGKDYGGMATEVMSMGLQYLYEDAAHFLRSDRDMFLHVIRELVRIRGGR